MGIINLDYLKQFADSNYARHLVFKTGNIEIVLMCWLPGQGTPVHGHGNSDAMTMVIDGAMSYTTHLPSGETSSGILRKGEVEHIPVGITHEVHNHSAQNLVTLHIYSPPLASDVMAEGLSYNNDTKLETINLNQETISYLMGCMPATIAKRKRSIVIIGGGLSGTLVATHLMKSKQQEDLQVILIERAPKFSRGFAYSTNSPKHFLNVPAAKMSAFPDQPEHFLNWARKYDSSIEASSFAPRMLYGEYLESTLLEANATKAENIGFKRINDEALSINVDEQKGIAHICLESGITIEADKVVLAVGNYPPKNPGLSEPSFYSSALYVRDPWSPSATAGIQSQDRVLLVGTGLTMVDKAIELHERKHQVQVIAVSRHGLVPQVHDLSAGLITVDYQELESCQTLLATLRLIRKQIKASGNNWRAYMDGLRPHTQKLWSRLSLQQRKQFFRHLRPYWDVHRHRIPAPAATILDAMLESQQLSTMAGRVKSYKQLDDKEVEVTIELRGSAVTTKVVVNKVINCTGSEQDFCQIEDPLVLNLLKQSLVMADETGLGLLADEHGALIGAKKSEILFTLGPPLKGQLWETTAVPEIRNQAKQLALYLLQTVVALI